ncbi:MAG: FIST N-terminal domain-containing protein [Psychroserpens sp.]|uniref:FIST signal transduction protein n=1 Tax=Psychroserpens sp. TaxID=2020870 RepID=UPI003C77F052
MNVEQLSLTQDDWSEKLTSISVDAHLFLLFVSPEFDATQHILNFLNERFPNAIIIGCSTAGEISDVTVKDNTISLTAIHFEKTVLRKVSLKIDDMDRSYQAGEDIGEQLNCKDLSHVMILSEGLNANGSDLVLGLKSKLPHTSITGGLAADGMRFEKTFLIDDNLIVNNYIVGLGFYGHDLLVGSSSRGGWDSLSLEREVTKSSKNVLYELDGLPALEIYKSFIGREAQNLPSSGSLFPLSMRHNEKTTPLVRTILAVNDDEQSITFSGNIIENSYVRLLKANMDRLIGGAEDSAICAKKNFDGACELAILVSCVGRRMVLEQLIEEEVEVVREVLGSKPKIAGFYSYGEIAPFDECSVSELHNQTMTITILSEC